VWTSRDRGATSYSDTDVLVGARLIYEIDALDASGNVIGHGETGIVTCC
jgi:hypothetical protein